MDAKEGPTGEKWVEPSETSRRLGKGREVREEDQSILKKLKALIIPLMGGGIENCIPLKGVRFWNISGRKYPSIPPTLATRANG
jgi:hypothetical protein